MPAGVNSANFFIDRGQGQNNRVRPGQSGKMSMSESSPISVGQCSDQGRKDTNQDFHGVYVPDAPVRNTKGVAAALADGISSSDVSRAASESAVAGFLEDYFCTPEAWSVKQSAQRVLMATNSWLHAETRRSQYRYDMDRGYVCTLTALIIKSATAHIFHVGDARAYSVHATALEQLTEDHRVRVTAEQSHLGRALGADQQVEIDYQSLPVEQGDLFLMTTDGIHEYVSPRFMARTIHANGQDLDAAARIIVDEAFEQGSPDNLTVQIVRVDEVADQSSHEVYQQLTRLPFPPALEPGTTFDGYRIVRKLHASSRSHVYLAEDPDTQRFMALKTLSTEMQSDPVQLERFLMEEWIAHRVNSAHVASAYSLPRTRNYLYTVMEFIDGRTLSQWMQDNPRPDLETVRGIVEQIVRGLRAFHRMEMIHQDLRPANIMVDTNGTVKLIDFGSARVAGVMEIAGTSDQDLLLGTAQYAAPEYFLGEPGSTRSDLFSLGVITYQMLTGQLPYGVEVAKCKTRMAQNRLTYTSALKYNRELPAWIDPVLRKALHPDPFKRYEALSEFTFDLRHPSKELLSKGKPPLLESNPVLFWQLVSLALAMTVMVLLVR